MKLQTIKKQITKDQVGQWALFPVSQYDFDEFYKIKSNRPVLTEVKHFRSPVMVKLFHKYWATVKLIADHTDDKMPEDIHDYLKLKTGLVDYMDVKNINGESIIRVKTKSIAWHRMTPDEFEIYWNKCEPIICKMLGCTIQELNDNLVF